MAVEDMIDVSTPASGSTSDEDESDDEPVEQLFQGRERRKTAGNRYDRQMVQEQADEVDQEDEVTLLFAGEQDEIDEEFKSEVSDEDDMSSSDDDDQGPNAAADDMEGEKELEKQAKVERAQKRKAKDALTSTAALRKRPKIDPTAPKAAPKKPSKKKERVTWLPDLNNAGGRNSLRKQTIAHRATTIARLKESEAQSKINKVIREKREKEKARDAPKAMTQTDRIAEAERTERRNAKSLNRWEAMEKKRNDEQAAKLAALKNRKLEGPVISFRSAKQKYRAHKFPASVPGLNPVMDEGPKKRGRKTNAYHEQLAKSREEAMQVRPQGLYPITVFQPIQPSNSVQLPTQPLQNTEYGAQHTTQVSSASMTPQTAYSAHHTPQTTPGPTVLPTPGEFSKQTEADPKGHPVALPDTKLDDNMGKNADLVSHTSNGQPEVPKNESFLHGIFDYANMEGEDKLADENQLGPTSEVEVKVNEPKETALATEEKAIQVELATPSTNAAENQDARPVTDLKEPSSLATGTAALLEVQAPFAPAIQNRQLQQPMLGNPVPHQAATHLSQSPTPLIQVLPDPPASTTQAPQPEPVPPVVPIPEIPIEEGFMTKNFITLNNFEELSATQKHEYSVFYNTRKTAKPTRHNTTLCPITLLPARYRDPATGIGYANMHAYKVLQELKEHKFSWSSMLGCYVGRDGAPIARGCPEGFLTGREATVAAVT